MNFVVEPEKKIPIYAQEDVVVCGGGVAGIGAAIAAARSGASALLIERNNGLGGDASVAGSALLYQNAKDARGILRELIDRMVEMNGVVTDFRTDYPPHNLGSGPGVDFVVYEPETFKQVALDMLEEAGVKLLLYTQFSAPIMQGNKTIGVFVENKSGRQAILSKVVLDCTGDADVAAR
jgi:flavin-dependent dehydrogenase